jgi:hypothetical protein
VRSEGFLALARALDQRRQKDGQPSEERNGWGQDEKRAKVVEHVMASSLADRAKMAAKKT